MEESVQLVPETLKDICDLYGIELVFLFGSHVKNRTTPESDLDIGIYLSNRISPERIWKLQCSLMGIYERCDIDLVILNDASPLLLFDLLLNHKLIYMRDEEVLYRFFSWARKRYWQYQIHFKKYAIQLENVRLKAIGMTK